MRALTLYKKKNFVLAPTAARAHTVAAPPAGLARLLLIIGKGGGEWARTSGVPTFCKLIRGHKARGRAQKMTNRKSVRSRGAP